MIVEADHGAESAFVRSRLKVIQSLCSDGPHNQKLSSCGQNFAEEAGDTDHPTNDGTVGILFRVETPAPRGGQQRSL